MKTKIVLVVSHDADGSAKLLMQRLDEIGQPYVLVDLGLYPTIGRATIKYTSDEVICEFNGIDKLFTTDSVKSIWWRRPKGKVKPVTINPVQKYMELESEIFLNSFFNFFKKSLWVSDPERTRIANHKPLQLEIARQIGLRIPLTIISNDPLAVASFIDAHSDMPMVMKPVGTSFIRIKDDPDTDKQNIAIYTKLIDKRQILEKIDMVANCPVIFQEAAEQEFDVRITVVGKNVFAVKVGHSNDYGAGSKNVDWRHQKLDRKFEPHDLPSELSEKCVQLVENLGLKFGALDFGFSKKKGYVFFEINPQGQWVPSETMAGLPVSLTLAKLLAEC